MTLPVEKLPCPTHINLFITNAITRKRCCAPKLVLLCFMDRRAPHTSNDIMFLLEHVMRTLSSIAFDVHSTRVLTNG